MFLDAIAQAFFNATDDLEDKLWRIAMDCTIKAQKVLPENVCLLIDGEYLLHDAYIMGIILDCPEKPRLSFKIKSRKIDGELSFNDIISWDIHGHIPNSQASFPVEKEFANALSQILYIWFDYTDSLECVILFDSGRYICIKAQTVQYCDRIKKHDIGQKH